MKDGDDLQKKKWFSRKKKPSLSPNTVSRPPSTASFGSSRRKPSSLASTDDGLPARESIETPPPQDTNVPPIQTSDGQPLRAPTPDIPVHAGFDLKAIKDMIGESEKNPEELQVPQNSRVQSSPAMSQSDSAPPDLATRAVSARKPIESPVAPHADMSATFATSLSLHSGPDVSDSSQGVLPGANDLGSRDDLASASSATPHATTIPQISFGANEGSIWSPPSVEKRSAAFVNPFATNGVSLGNTSGSIRSSSFSDDLHNSYSPESGSSASLSFGGADGTITLQDMDLWKIPVGDSKKTPSYLSNPWS